MPRLVKRNPISIRLANWESSPAAAYVSSSILNSDSSFLEALTRSPQSFLVHMSLEISNNVPNHKLLTLYLQLHFQLHSIGCEFTGPWSGLEYPWCRWSEEEPQ